MTNVSETPEKVSLRHQLFRAAEEALQRQGWTVTRVPGAGKSSLRQIKKGADTKLVSIRTTQDRWIAFPRTRDDQSWVTLADVDFVVAASVDDKDNPQFALVHMIPGDDARDRFDRAYQARIGAGHTIPVGRGIWVSLYDRESNNPVSLIGAGAGLKYAHIARVPLNSVATDPVEGAADDPSSSRAETMPSAEAPTAGPSGPIPSARRWLAQQLGVAESDIKISVNF